MFMVDDDDNVVFLNKSECEQKTIFLGKERKPPCDISGCLGLSEAPTLCIDLLSEQGASAVLSS